MAATNSELGTNVELGSKDVGLSSGMEQAALAVKNSTAQMQGSINDLGSIFEKFKGQILGMTAILGGGALFAEGVKKTNELVGETMKLSKQLGITSTEASTLNVALKSVGSSSDVYLGANQMLTRQLRTNEDGLKQMGVQTRNSNGELKNSSEIMTSALNALREYKEGTDRNLAAQTMFGRGASEVAGLLKLNNEVFDKAAEKAKALGLVIGPEQAAATRQYKEAMEGVKLVVDAVQNVIGQALLPVLTELGEMFAESGPSRVNIMRTVMQGLADVFGIVLRTVGELKDIALSAFAAIGDAITANADKGAQKLDILKNVMSVIKITVLGLELAFVTVFETIRGVIEAAVAQVQWFGKMVAAVMNMNWDDVADLWKRRFEGIGDAAQATAERIAVHASRIADDMQRAAMGEQVTGAKAQVGAAGGAKPDKAYVAPVKTGPDDARMKAWENELMLAKITFMRENEYREMSLSKEQEFWDGKLAIADLSDKERDSLTKRRQASEFAELKTTGARILALTQETIDEQKRIDLDRVAAAKVNADYMLATYQINQKDRLGLDIEYARQTYEIERSALVSRMELLAKDPTKNAVELAKINGQLLELERKYQIDKTKLTQTYSLEANKWMIEGLKATENAFANSIENMILKGQTLRQSMANIANAIVTSFVQSGAKMAANWAMTELTKTAASKAGAAERTAIEWAAAAQSVAAGAWAAIKNIMNYAWEAMAGAFASLVGIPVVGPALATAESGAAFGMISALAGSIASARGGYDIPAGVNPVTQLHEREMVLPKEQADQVRNMTSGGTYHFNVTAMDSRSVKQFLQDNAPAVAAAMKTAQRNFAG